MTVEEKKEQTDLTYGPTRGIIKDHLQLTSITAHYIPKELTDFLRNERVRIWREKNREHKGEKRDFSVPVFHCCFADTSQYFTDTSRREVSVKY